MPSRDSVILNGAFLKQRRCVDLFLNTQLAKCLFDVLHCFKYNPQKAFVMINDCKF